MVNEHRAFIASHVDDYAVVLWSHHVRALAALLNTVELLTIWARVWRLSATPTVHLRTDQDVKPGTLRGFSRHDHETLPAADVPEKDRGHTRVYVK